MIGREADAALAEAIGCKVSRPEMECGCPPEGRREQRPHAQAPLKRSLMHYATAPTGDTMLQLIEGLAAKYRVSIVTNGYECTVEIGDVEVEGNANEIPAAVAQAALRAIGKGGEE